MLLLKNHLVCDITLQQPEMPVVTSAWGSSKHHREVLNLRVSRKLLLPGTVGVQ